MVDIFLGHRNFKRLNYSLCIEKWSSFPVLFFIQSLEGDKNSYIEEYL
jgi:hypothetical protein